MSYLVLFLVLATTCGMLASIVAALQSIGARRGVRPRGGTWVSAGWALLPVLLGLVAFVVLLVPASNFGCHCSAHGGHHPHFCVLHPAFAVPLLVPAACAIGVWAALVAPRLWRLARDLVVAERWSEALRAAPTDLAHGIAVHLVDDLALGAFTVGVLRPAIVADRALWSRLDADERRAIVHHEHAHAERLDGLTLAVLRAAAALTLWPASAGLVRAWKRATEMACDEHAAQVVGDRAAVAQALVSVERIRAGMPACGEHAAALGVAAGAELERRVMRLLDGDPARSRSPVLGNDLVAVAIVLLGAVVLVVSWPGDSFHHAVETVMGHLVP